MCSQKVTKHDVGTNERGCISINFIYKKKFIFKPPNTGESGWLSWLSWTLDFGSGHDLVVHEIQPRVRLCRQQGACLRFSLPAPRPSLTCTHSLPQNKYKNKPPSTSFVFLSSLRLVPSSFSSYSPLAPHFLLGNFIYSYILTTTRLASSIIIWTLEINF